MKKIKLEINELKNELLNIESSLRSNQLSHKKLLDKIHPVHKEGAVNLLDYLILRQNNLESIQHRLTNLGLSSLGRSEACVKYLLSQVIDRLHGYEFGHTKVKLDIKRSRERLKNNTLSLLGPLPDKVPNHIIVTAPDFSEITEEWLTRLLKLGMSCLRINCAHGSQGEWKKTIDLLRLTSKTLNKECRVMMDLAGPKIRTEIFHFREQNQTWKQVKTPNISSANPLLIKIVNENEKNNSILYESFSEEDHYLILPDFLYKDLQKTDWLTFHDARGKKRKIEIIKNGDKYFIGRIFKTASMNKKILLTHWRNDEKRKSKKINYFYNPDPWIELSAGDKFELVQSLEAFERTNRKTPLQQVACLIPELFTDLKVGHRVLFDDGKLETLVRNKLKNKIILQVIRSPKTHYKLKNRKGINFPDTELKISGLTLEDEKNIPFILKNSDILSFSFVNNKDDVRNLLKFFIKSKNKAIGLVLKIETKSGFRNLPSILFESMKHPYIGIMIARGDLAVESGFERMAEVQEEILWFCEAAHIPAIWATQVLENLAKFGLPSRAEITDAAMSGRAEAIMLNKGPYIHKAIESLIDILRRMHTHQNKKKSLLKELNISKIPFV